METMIPTAPLGNSSTSAAALAARNNTLGVGFSGSGFLIFYFTGVVAILKHLGIIADTTRLAGASGGASVAVLTCANVTAQQQYRDQLNLAVTCRANANCQGILDQAFNEYISAATPANGTELCSGRLWVSVTAAKPEGQNDTNILLGGNWTSRPEILAALRVSSYLPSISGPSATLRLPELPAVGAGYDGGFTLNLPCPPGVSFCISVSSVPLVADLSVSSVGTLVGQLNAAATTDTQEATALKADPATGPFLPLNPVTLPDPKPVIYPGLSQPLPVNSTVWGSWGLMVQDEATTALMYDIGRRDAAFWASKALEGLATAAEATAALQATGLAAANSSTSA